MSARTLFRLPRASVFAAVCVSVSLGGHAAASNSPVPVPGAVAGFLLVLGVGWVAASRERGYGAILAWLLWAQLALHLIFHQTQARLSGAPSAAGTGHLAGHPPAAGAGSGDESFSMLLAHLVAALVGAWWLRRGEAAAFALARALRTSLLPELLVRAGTARCVLPLSAVPAARPDSPALYGTVLPHIRPLRGPPLRTRIR
ncbi:hypothetical protein F4561_003044 [Lipingzhangella halophila]|uniref:MFS transporter n=1 Tax=Lipingzhangella halophila TaxID=1783352 RepID=A0A7W7RHT9_9ACTN|nr:hypothetical protein [Lipingzhangella halophila]MBB4932224.1 hypothetical protein [Lipingzhangella halophila]